MLKDSAKRLLLGDCCQTPGCEKAWVRGAPPCYPYSWQVAGGRIAARYVCLRCTRTWSCGWGDFSTVFYDGTDLTEENISRCVQHGDEAGSACESPVEKRFWVIAQAFIPHCVPQVRIGPYRADFALPNLQLVIEIDGRDFHTQEEQIKRDEERAQWLRSQRWQVLRFTGTEVTQDVCRCVLLVLEVVAARYQLRRARPESTLGLFAAASEHQEADGDMRH